jgi:hypothetical protein
MQRVGLEWLFRLMQEPHRIVEALLGNQHSSALCCFRRSGAPGVVDCETETCVELGGSLWRR